MSDPVVRVFVLPPELGDGASRSLIKIDEISKIDLPELLGGWLAEATDGEEIVIGWRETTDGELEDLEGQ